MGAVFYVGLAIQGTGQEGKSEIAVSKVKEWLIKYAQKITDKWGFWLASVGIETDEDIEAAIIEWLEIYFTQKKRPFRKGR